VADAKITELTELTTLDNEDLIVIVDDSEVPKTTKKMKILNLFNKVFLGIDQVDNTSDADKPVSTDQQTAIDLKYNASNPDGFLNESSHDSLPSDNPHNVSKSQIGLGNADNTSDIDKPVSTDQQTALDLKYNANNPSDFQTGAEVAQSITDHENLADPHSQYLTETEADANYYDIANPSGFETSAELNARDVANRDRANHTGSQLSNTISNFATTVKNVVLSGLNVVNSVVTNSDTVQEAIGKLQGQINQKGFLQYQNNATISSTGAWVTIPMPTNRESLPNGLFTKTNNNNFRADFDGYTEISFSIIVDSADNDRSFNVRILKNGIEIPQGFFENIACGKAQNQRRGGMSSSFIASCSDGDLFSIQLQEADSSTVQVFSGGCLMTIKEYKVNP